MKRKFKLIVPSFLTLIFCLLLIAGSTFAIFSSTDDASIAVKSGKVEVSATITELAAFSAQADDTVTDQSANWAGEVTSGLGAGKYKYVNATQLENGFEFTNGGTAKLTNTKALSLDKLTPGDKVTAKISLVNSSNVDIKYRAKVNLVSGLKLFEALQIKLDGVLLQGVSKVGTWTYLSAPQLDQNGDPIDNMTDITIEIVLPIDAENVYQDLSTKVNFTVEAVQGNAKTVNETLNTNVNASKPVTQATAAQEQVIQDSEQLVTVTIPANAVAVTDAENKTTSLEVKVEPQTTVSDLSTVVTSEQVAQSYDLDVIIKTQVGDAAPTTEKYNKNNEASAAGLTIKMFVGEGLKGVELYHKTSPMTKVNSLAEVDQVGEFFYDSESGYITLMTNSFSEYTVVYNKDLVVETVVNNESQFTTYEATEDKGVYTDSNDNIVVVEKDSNNNDVIVAKLAYLIHNNEKVMKNTLQEAFAAAVSGDTVGLAADIDLENGEWTPVGTSSQPFVGVFDGNNHKISNLTISSSPTDVSAGLFGYIENSTIKNLKIVGANITVDNKSGIIAGHIDYNTVFENINIDSTSKISGKSNIGGLVGVFQGREFKQVEIKNCTISAEIVASSDRAAGFFGAIYWSEATAYVSNSTFNGSVKGNRIGQFVGRSTSGFTADGSMAMSLHFYNSHLDGTLINPYTDNTEWQYGYINGWQADVNFTATLDNCTYKNVEGNIVDFAKDTKFVGFYDGSNLTSHVGVDGSFDKLYIPAMSYTIDFANKSMVFTLLEETSYLEFMYKQHGGFDNKNVKIIGQADYKLLMRCTGNHPWSFTNNSQFYDQNGVLIELSDNLDSCGYRTREFVWDPDLGTNGGWRLTRTNFAYN